jgi:hypothetical protein
MDNDKALGVIGGLKALGYAPGENSRNVLTDRATVNAVTAFQRDIGVNQSGTISPQLETILLIVNYNLFESDLK